MSQEHWQTAWACSVPGLCRTYPALPSGFEPVTAGHGQDWGRSSLSPWKCHHLYGAFLALDIFHPSSQCKVLKQWMRKGVVAIGWWEQSDKCCPVRDSPLYLLFHLFFRWLKTIEIKRCLHDAEASIPSSEGTGPDKYIRPQWQSVDWILQNGKWKTKHHTWFDFQEDFVT